MENNPQRFGQCCDKCGRPKMSCICSKLPMTKYLSDCCNAKVHKGGLKQEWYCECGKYCTIHEVKEYEKSCIDDCIHFRANDKSHPCDKCKFATKESNVSMYESVKEEPKSEYEFYKRQLDKMKQKKEVKEEPVKEEAKLADYFEPKENKEYWMKTYRQISQILFKGGKARQVIEYFYANTPPQEVGVSEITEKELISYIANSRSKFYDATEKISKRLYDGGRVELSNQILNESENILSVLNKLWIEYQSLKSQLNEKTREGREVELNTDFDKWLNENHWEWKRASAGHFMWYKRKFQEKGIDVSQLGKTTSELFQLFLTQNK